MNFFLSAIGLVFFTVLRVVSADSANFTLKCYAPGTVLSDANLFIDDDFKIYLANTTSTSTGYVMTNGSLMMDVGKVVGIGKNFISLVPASSSFEIAEPFSIQGGVLKLYGEDFHAVPSGQNNTYVLGSINAASGRADVVTLQIKAVDKDGVAVKDYSPGDAQSSSFSLIGSQTFDSSSASQAEAATSAGGTASSKNGAAVMSFGFSSVITMLVAMII